VTVLNSFKGDRALEVVFSLASAVGGLMSLLSARSRGAHRACARAHGGGAGDASDTTMPARWRVAEFNEEAKAWTLRFGRALFEPLGAWLGWGKVIDGAAGLADTETTSAMRCVCVCVSSLMFVIVCSFARVLFLCVCLCICVCMYDGECWFLMREHGVASVFECPNCAFMLHASGALTARRCRPTVLGMLAGCGHEAVCACVCVCVCLHMCACVRA
jgi:hypothetical protein